MELLRLAARGVTNQEYACELNLAAKAIRHHMVNVFVALGGQRGRCRPDWSGGSVRMRPV